MGEESTERWTEDEPWSDGADEAVGPETREKVEATLAQRWPALASYAETVAQRPSETIVPADRMRTTAGERAMAAVRLAEAPEQRLEVAEDVLGVGGMSVVRHGLQVALDRKVAVKELPEREGAKPAAGTIASLELLQEARITGRLEHPNVVPIYDLVLDPAGRPRLVMKRIEGVRWTELMENPAAVRERFGAQDALVWHLGLFMQVCHAIHFAHGRGVIHRDIKPDNVMIGAYGEVYVLDWGIALTEDAPRTGSIAGTPPYMAPEMMEGRPITVRTDVYLLGGLLYELVAGHPPHDGRSLKEIARKVLLSRPPIPPDVDPDLGAIIRRALDRDPSERFADAETFRRAIQEYLERREARALTHAAQRDLGRFEELAALAHTEASLDGDERAELHDLFGACRFGFRAALARQPDAEEARQGLDRALETMIELELARENVRGAKALLAEMHAPRPDFRDRVNEAARSNEAHRRKLERIAFHHDPRVANETRWYVLWFLAIVWTASPLVHQLVSATTAWTDELVRPLVYCVVLVALMAFKREALAANLFNRQLWGGALTLFASEWVMTLGQWLAGMDPEVAAIQDYAVRGVCVGFLAIFIEPILWIGAVASAVAFLTATRWPEQRFVAISVANVFIMAPLLWRWRPRRDATR
ncbi:MAG: hypothetical protein CMN30_04365 [Sandaracinus sp.]|nr:hypothetical protein [Sandaracinus sp.]